MNTHDLLTAVRSMRRAQRALLDARTLDPLAALHACKAAETRVDALIAEEPPVVDDRQFTIPEAT